MRREILITDKVRLRKVGQGGILIYGQRRYVLDSQARRLVEMWFSRHFPGEATRTDIYRLLVTLLNREPTGRELASAMQVITRLYEGEAAGHSLYGGFRQVETSADQGPADLMPRIARLDLLLSDLQDIRVENILDRLEPLFRYRIVCRLLSRFDEPEILAKATDKASAWFCEHAGNCYGTLAVVLRCTSAKELMKGLSVLATVDTHQIYVIVLATVSCDFGALSSVRRGWGSDLYIVPTIELHRGNFAEALDFLTVAQGPLYLSISAEQTPTTNQLLELVDVIDTSRQTLFVLEDCQWQILLTDLGACPGGRSVLTVDGRGAIYPCLLLLKEERWCLGNVAQETPFCTKTTEELRLAQEMRKDDCVACLAESECSHCLSGAGPFESTVCDLKKKLWVDLT